MRRLAVRVGKWLHHPGVRLLLVLAVLGVLLAKADRAELGRYLARFDPLYGMLMASVFLLLIGLFALRWWVIASRLGVQVPIGEFVRITWITQAISEVGPAMVVGELTRFQLMRRFGNGWPLAVSQGLDRLSGKLVLLVMVGLLTPYYLRLYRGFPVGQVVLLVLLLCAAVGFFVWLARRFWPLAKAHSAAVRMLASPLQSPGHYLASLAVQSLLALNLVLSARALGVNHDFSMLFASGLLLLLGVAVVPGLVSDWGKREAAAILVFAPAGLGTEESLVVSLLFGTLHLLVALPGVLLLLQAERRPRFRRGA